MGNVKMRIWDVKHGNAIFIKTPNNKNLVFDLGVGDYSEGSEGRSPLETLKNHYKIDTIHYLMITHPHKDHIDDILNVDKFNLLTLHRPKSFDVNSLLDKAKETDKPKFKKYIELHNRFSTIADANQSISNPENYGGVSFKHFSTPNLPDTNLNNHSLITCMQYEGIKIIIPGDNEYDSLDQLMNREEFRETVSNSHILLAPHHGRESAYHSEFVKLVNPHLTIISDGSICDTSANSKYSSNSQGWGVWKNQKKIERKLLTTNCDGEIYIDFGKDDSRYLKVEIK